MSLNLNNHLLQAPDGLFASLLGHLALEVVLPAGFVILRLVLALVRNGVRSLIFHSAKSSCGASNRIQACGLTSTFLLLTSSQVSSGGGITVAIWVSSLRGIASGLLCITFAERNLGLDLVTKGGRRQVWDVVPCVLFSWLIESAESILGRLNLASSLGGSVASNGAEKDSGVAYWEMLECITKTQKMSTAYAVFGIGRWR
jgi:hypothetical protein